jgi:hypothetical protein
MPNRGPAAVEDMAERAGCLCADRRATRRGRPGPTRGCRNKVLPARASYRGGSLGAWTGLQADRADPVGDRMCQTLRVAPEMAGSDLGTAPAVCPISSGRSSHAIGTRTRQGWAVNAANPSARRDSCVEPLKHLSDCVRWTGVKPQVARSQATSGSGSSPCGLRPYVVTARRWRWLLAGASSHMSERPSTETRSVTHEIA